MTPVVGVFASRSDAAQGMERLERSGFTRDHINILTPASSDEQIAAVPVSDSEQPGMGAAIGSVVGGALGSAGGFGAGAALASFLVPGVGPVLAGGLLGASLLGLGGLAGGAAAGDAMEDMVSGVPRDELYVYEDALRQGRTIIIVQADTDAQAEAVRKAARASRSRKHRRRARRMVDRPAQRRARKLPLRSRRFRCGRALLSQRIRSGSIARPAREIL